MFTGLDLASLSLMDALDLAVLIEVEAKERYDDLAQQLELHHTPEAAHFFRFMSKNEGRHRDELDRRRHQLFGAVPSRITPAMVFEIEAPEFDEARAFMSKREALQAAFRAEKKAWHFFVETLPHLTDHGVRVLFEELRDEEIHHQQLVLAEMDKTPPESALHGFEQTDEPVAQ